MSKKLFVSAKKNVLSNYTNYIFSAIITLFLNPFLVKFLGDYYYGVWNAVRKFLDFATVADGRATQALKWVIANKADSDDASKQQAVGSAIKVWLMFLPFFILLVVVLVIITPHLIHNLQAIDTNVVRITVFILAVNISIYPLLEIPDAVLVGINLGYKSMNMQTFWMLVSNVLMVGAAWLGYGPMGLGGVMLLITLVSGISVFFICKANALWFGVKKPEKKDVKEFMSFSVWVLVWSAVARLLLSSEIILFSSLIGPKQVTTYNLSSYIIQMGLSMAMVTGSSVLPGLGTLISSKDHEKVSFVVQSTREIIFFLAILMGAGILALNQSFIDLWVGSKYYMGSLVNWLMVICMVQLIIIRNEGQIQDITLNIGNKVRLGIGSTVLGMGFAVLFFKFSNGNIATIFYGLILGRMLMSIIFPLIVNRMLNSKNIEIKRYVYGAIILACGYGLGRLYTATNWFYFAGYFIACGAALAVLSYNFLLRKENRNLLVKKLLKK